MTKSIRLAFVINSLEGGGAERVFCEVIDGVLNKLSSVKAELVLLDSTVDAYSPRSAIPVSRLNASGSFSGSVLKLQKQLRSFRPHVTLSFLARANCACVLSARRLGFRSIISERVATDAHLGGGLRAALLKQVTRVIYRRADRIIAVSEGVQRSLQRSFGIPSEQVDVIYNPIDTAKIKGLASRPHDGPLPARFIAAIGRLQPNKNFEMLVRSFAAANPAHDLVIMGDGPQRPALETLIRTLDLQSRVHLLGFQSNPFSVLGRAAAYVSASNAEGFPNALVEAMSLGLPCIHTNCEAGPAEILANDVDLSVDGLHQAPYGLLTPPNDLEAMAEAIRSFDDAALLQRYREPSLERAMDFAPDKIFDAFADVIDRVISPPVGR